jgi:hypothetical protein
VGGGGAHDPASGDRPPVDLLTVMWTGPPAAAAEAFGTAWLETYGMDVDARVTDVVGTFALDG